MFTIDRTFSCFNLDTGLTDWFFNVRGGICGPYSSNEEASKCLKEFIKKSIEIGDDGGRIKPEQQQFSILPKEYSIDANHYDPFKQKKGRESL